MVETAPERLSVRGGQRAVVAAAAVLLSLWGAGDSAAAGRQFAPLDAVQLPAKQVFDLGATDYNDDGLIDLFTTNHKSHSPLLRNDGSLRFSDQTGPAGFSQTPEFPGLELLRAPAQDQQGVYLYVTDSDRDKLPGVVHLRSNGATLSGTLTFTGEGLSVERSDNARVVTRQSGRETLVDFDVRPNAAVDIRVKPIDIPFAASFASAPPGQLPPPFPQPVDVPVFVGTDAVPATRRQFLITIRDRHGYAFADLGGGDPAPDVFAVSGGLGGSIGLTGYKGRVQDELLLGSGGAFVNATPNSGLIKGDCRGRGAAAVDFDGDGLLDLFEGCEGRRPQAYRQESRGAFTRIRSPRVTGQSYRWVELGGGSRPELLASVGRRGVQVLRLERRGWKVLQTVRANAGGGGVAQFALNDIDSDGDLDVLAVAGSGNTMFRNQGGRLRELPLTGLGLPEKSVAASFVDFDNDGRVDVHLVPQGLHVRGMGLRFRRSGGLGFGGANAGITIWPDLDNDGDRDPVVATGDSIFSKSKRVEAFVNRGRGGHWLEVDLAGAPGNVQAIGARIAIGAGAGRRFAWVGQSDDSHFSQGHYRAYFGLGKRTRVSTVVVEWPDGAVSRLKNVAADQVLRLTHP